VEQFLTLIIFFIVIGLVERVLKAAQKAKAEPPAQREAEEDEESGLERLPSGLQDLIAEELGINLERKPRIERPPEPAPPASARAATVEYPARRPPPAAPPRGPAPPAPPAAPATREGAGYRPSPRREALQRGREPGGDRAAALARARREAAAQRRRAPALTREPLRQAEAPMSLEERAMLERGEPVSLERPRRPEDHERFHERYMERAAASDVRRRRGKLPERPHWNAVQKAIVWAEILGRPKGLED